MKMKYLFFLVLLSSCMSKSDSASESLQGVWNVTKISQTVDGTTDSQDGMLGTFEFTQTTVDYSYQFNGVTEANDFEYQLDITRENAGFTNVDRFDIVGEENFRVRFGDQTSDAYENADMMVLERVLVTDSLSLDQRFILEKN